MKKVWVFVLLVVVIGLSSAAVAVEMKRMGEEAPATVTPGITKSAEIEYLTLDVSCFINEEPVSVNVLVYQIDASGNIIPDTIESNWSEDGRVRFSVNKGGNYRIKAATHGEPPDNVFVHFITAYDASHEINNMIHSTALGLVLTKNENFPGWPTTSTTVPTIHKRIIAPIGTITTTTTTSTTILRPMGTPLKRL